MIKRGILPVSKLRTIENAKPRIKMAEAVGERGGGKFRHLYRTKRWLKLREEILKRDMYTCGRCGAVGAAAGMLVCDHVRGHPANETEKMFWEGPFQTLCATCHSSWKAREENAEKKRMTYDDLVLA